MDPDPAPLPLNEHFANLISWIQTILTGKVSLEQLWHDIYWSPIFHHPPFMVAFLICTLLPLLLFVDSIGKDVPGESKTKTPKKETKKTQ